MMAAMGRMIPDEIVQQVRSASDVVDVIQSYVPLKRAGASWKALSPFQKEKTPSFHVSPARQTWHCFSSNRGGDVFKFVMLYENVDFPTAVRKLADRAGIPVPDDGPDDGGASRNLRKALLEVHNLVAGWWARLLHTSKKAEPAREYLRSRAMGKELAREWGLGYAPDEWEATLEYVRQRGYRDEVLRESGLFSEKEAEGGRRARIYDRFRGRLMFPICDDSGQVIAFSGRTLDPNLKGAKYVNSGASPLFRKSEVFFGLHKTKRTILDTRRAVLCEGQIDLIRMWEHGIRNAVAPQGTAFTEVHGKMLKRLADEVIICFDADRAGQKASEKSVEILLESDLSIRIARMPPGEDPDSLLRKHGKEAMEKVLADAPDFVDHLLDVVTAENDTSTPRGLTTATHHMAGILRRVKNPTMREAVGHRIANRLRQTYATLMREVEKAQGPKPRFAEMAGTSGQHQQGPPPRPRGEWVPGGAGHGHGAGQGGQGGGFSSATSSGGGAVTVAGADTDARPGPGFGPGAGAADLQSGGADVGEVPAGHVTKAPPFVCSAIVRDMLSLLLPRPELVPVIHRGLLPEWLAGLEGAHLLEEVLSAHSDDALDDIATFLSGLPDSEQNFLSELLVSPAPLPDDLKPEDYEAYAQKLLLRMEERFHLTRRQILQEEIKRANLPADELMARMKELAAITSKMQNSKHFGA